MVAPAFEMPPRVSQGVPEKNDRLALIGECGR